MTITTFWSIVLLMAGCGLLGGLINYFLLGTEKTGGMKWWQHVAVGLGASFMVPLFLNMISSGLVSEIQGGTNKTGDDSKMLVLAGFCLVAAISSRAFITSMTDRVLRVAEEAKEAATEAKVDAAEAKATVEPLVEKDDVDPAAADSAHPGAAFIPAAALQGDEATVIQVMKNSSFAMRSLSGIAKQGGIDPVLARAALTSLVKKELVAEGATHAGYKRWYLTSEGRTRA